MEELPDSIRALALPGLWTVATPAEGAVRHIAELKWNVSRYRDPVQAERRFEQIRQARPECQAWIIPPLKEK